MKNVFVTSIILLLFPMLVSGQYARQKIFWLDFGSHTELGSANLTNQNLRKDDNLYIKTFNPASSYGITTTFRMRKISIGVDGFVSQCSQRYNIKHPNLSYSYDKNVKIQSAIVAAFMRYSTSVGFYMETGPNFMFIRSAQASYKGNYHPLVREDQTDRYRGFSTHVMAGAGFRLFSNLSNRIHINMGMRTYFNATDIMVDGVDSPPSDDVSYIPEYSSPDATRLISLRLRLEVVYALASFEKTTSGRVNVKVF